MKVNLFKERIKKAIDNFNKYKGKEAHAKLISLNEIFFNIEFKGSFCYTCGFYDYFDDFKRLLEEIGLKTNITEKKEISEGAIIKFNIK